MDTLTTFNCPGLQCYLSTWGWFRQARLNWHLFFKLAFNIATSVWKKTSPVSNASGIPQRFNHTSSGFGTITRSTSEGATNETITRAAWGHDFDAQYTSPPFG